MNRKILLTTFVTALALNAIWLLVNSLLIDWYDVPFRTIISFCGPVIVHVIVFFVATGKEQRTVLSFFSLLLAFIAIHFGSATVALVGVMSLHWPVVIIPLVALVSLVATKIILEPYFMFMGKWLIAVVALTAGLALFLWVVSLEPIKMPRVPLFPFAVWQIISTVVLASTIERVNAVK